jgi:uncharacterized protein YcfJ
VVIAGYRLARDAALKALRAAAIDHSADPAAFRQDLLNIAMTTLSSKVGGVCGKLIQEGEGRDAVIWKGWGGGFG